MELDLVFKLRRWAQKAGRVPENTLEELCGVAITRGTLNVVFLFFYRWFDTIILVVILGSTTVMAAETYGLSAQKSKILLFFYSVFSVLFVREMAAKVSAWGWR